MSAIKANNEIEEKELKLSQERKKLRDKKIAAAQSKNHKFYWIFKRFCDLLLASLALVVLSPMFLIISLAIIIDDPHGSPIYESVRIGRHGKEFIMYKFRTMVVDADKMKDELLEKNQMDGPVFKIKDDPRITKVGKILRRISFDEFPQLINIIKGDMTIVGPRPLLPSEVEKYDEIHRMRLMVTPGLTCDWQVQPEKNDIPFEDWVDLDLDYIGKRSVWKDIKLIFRTVVMMFKHNGE
jgi:lipopolysaccharide/colanic/teichoic acid biosynthesis glycosyltransferase